MRKFKNCLITGISGSGGSYLANYINKINKKIKIYGTYRKKGHINKINNIKKISLYKNNLDNVNSIKKLLKKINPDVIFHLASNADVRESFDNPYNVIKNNSLLTLNLLEAVRLCKSKSLIIICSTSEVYGKVKKKDIPIKESQIFSPANPYSMSKSFQDLLAQTYYRCFKLNIIITRMFSYTNARRKNLFQSSFARQINQFRRGEINFVKHGNLKSIRTFMDIEDAMKAYWLTALKGKIGEIYNIGGDKIISVGDYLKKLIKISGVQAKTKLCRELVRPVDVTLQIPSVSKFRRDTGWKPNINFEESIKKLLNETKK